MCTKTKTSYGCGHSYKKLEDCGESCKEPDRYAFLKEGDCPACKRGGENVTRGRDGEGRYGRHAQRNRESESPPTYRKNAPGPIDVSGGAGPWTSVTRQAKAWDSPIRKMADDAWLTEHDRRMTDLQEKMDRHSLSSRSSREQSPRQSYETVQHETEHITSSPRKHKPKRHTEPLPYEVFRTEEDSDNTPRRRYRHNQDEPNDYHESPAARHTTPQIQFAAPSSEYDYYASFGRESQRRGRGRGAKTEPYSYAQSFIYDSPLSASPQTAAGGYWMDHYEVIQPTNYGYVFPRTTKVH